MNKIQIRHAKPSDHKDIISVIPHWWGGRDLRSSVPKLFLIHFGSSSFIAEKDGLLAGFLIGFMSQSFPDQGYIHFAGVRPDLRRLGLGRRLYHRFFDVCKKQSRTVVRSCTAPSNKLSVDFHRRMGFAIESGEIYVDDLPVTPGYLHENDTKVLFKKNLKGDKPNGN